MSCPEARYLGHGWLMHCEMLTSGHETHGVNVGGHFRTWNSGAQCSHRELGYRCFRTTGHSGEHVGLDKEGPGDIRWRDPEQPIPCGNKRYLSQDSGLGLYCVLTGEHDLHFASPCGKDFFWDLAKEQCTAINPEGRRCVWNTGHLGLDHSSIDEEGLRVHFSTVEACPHIRALGARHVMTCTSPFDGHTVHTARVQGKLMGWRTDEEQCPYLGPGGARCYQGRGHSAGHFGIMADGGPFQRWTTSKVTPSQWPLVCGASQVVDGHFQTRDRTLRCALHADHAGPHEGFANTSGRLETWGDPKTAQEANQAALRAYIKDKIAEVYQTQPKPRTYAERKKRRHP